MQYSTKYKILSLMGLVIFLFVVITNAQQEQIPFQNLLSTINVSENGEYVFALVPIQSVDEYVKETKVSWQRVGYSKSEIAQKEKELLPLIEKEKESRRKYKESGLYKKDNTEPIRKIESFPKEIDSIYVSNDGSYVVGFNADIITLGLNPNGSIKELLTTTEQNAVFALLFDNQSHKTCSKKVSDFNIEDAVNRRTHSLFWADKESSYLDSKSNILEIKKLNEEKIVFDVKNCRIIQGDIQKVSESNSSNKNGQSSFCLGIALLIMLASCRVG